MRPECLKSEAEECRRQAATAFQGRPEASFLLRLAEMFDELARDPSRAMPPQLTRGSPPLDLVEISSA
jgi:hypothetical protein